MCSKPVPDGMPYSENSELVSDLSQSFTAKIVFSTTLKPSHNVYYYSDNNKAVKTRKSGVGSSHDPQKQIRHIIEKIKKYPEIKFTIFTSYKKFPNLKNLTII